MHKTQRAKQERLPDGVVAIPYDKLVTIRTLTTMIEVQQQVLNDYVKEQLGVDIVNENWILDTETGVLLKHGSQE